MNRTTTWALALALSAVCAPSAHAQRRVVGVVSGAAGEPLGGVSVIVQGTTVGTYTSDDGRFAIYNAPSGAQVLLVRRLGFKRALVPLAATSDSVRVALEKDVLELETQVVTGTTTSVSSRNAANAVAVLSAAQLTEAPAPTVEHALQGKVAGAVVSTNSGAPGGGAQIQLRGVTSINASSSPLYVVDGVLVDNSTIGTGLSQLTNAGGALLTSGRSNAQDQAVNRIADLNPNDIETIEVLKGASAGAIYGSKASNGVILITTKHGEAGKPSLRVTQRVGQFSLAKTLGSRCFGSQQEAEDWYGGALPIPFSSTCHDFEREFFGGNGPSYETDLDVRGGGGGTTYYVGGLAKRDDAIQRNTYYQKQSLSASLSQALGSRATLRVSNAFTHSLTDRGISGNDNSPVVAPVDIISSTPSFFDMAAKVDGRYQRNPFLSEGTNAFQTADLVKNPEQVWRYTGGANATYSVFTSARQTFDVTLIGGLDAYQFNSRLYSPPDAFFESADALPGTIIANKSTVVAANLNLSGQHKLILPALTATTSFGVRRERRESDALYDAARNVPASVTDVQFGVVQAPAETQSLVKDAAAFAQEEVLALDDRLLLTGAVNLERSSVNGADRHYGAYPKLAASYRLPFLPPHTDDVKLRVAWGRAGNQPPYGYKYTALPYYVLDGQPVLRTSTTLGDADIRPEVSTELEGGVDVRLFGGRASVEATAFRKDVDDLILQAAVAPTTGYTTQYINGGALRNTGTELGVSVTPVQTRRVTWVSRTTYAKVNGLFTRLDVPCYNGGNYFSLRYGAPYVCAGSSTTAAQVYDGYDSTFVNGAYQSRARHLRTLESAPRFTMGFSNEVTFGPVRAYALLDWRDGGYVANLTNNYFDGSDLAADTATSHARFARYRQGYNTYFERASFLKLRELSLGVDVPRRLAGMRLPSSTHRLRVDVSGRNLFTRTPYTGYDPEVSNYGNQNIGRFQDVTPYPPSRSVFLSVSATF